MPLSKENRTERRNNNAIEYDWLNREIKNEYSEISIVCVHFISVVISQWLNLWFCIFQFLIDEKNDEKIK